MNKTVPLPKTHKTLHASFRLGILCLGLTLHTTLYAGMPSGMQSTGAHDTIHSIQVSRSQNSKKSRIKLYPDARQQVLFFSVNWEGRKVYQLYVFDMDGKLVQQAAVRNGETTVLTDISKGNYVFEVFSDDQRIENGGLAVK